MDRLGSVVCVRIKAQHHLGLVVKGGPGAGFIGARWRCLSLLIAILGNQSQTLRVCIEANGLRCAESSTKGPGEGQRLLWVPS